MDIDALQRVQNQAMLWIGGEGRRAFRVNHSLERLGWLDIGQTAAKASILSALKVIHSGTMQDCKGRQEGGHENKECLGRRVQKNESMEAEILEHKSKKVAEDDPTGYTGRESV